MPTVKTEGEKSPSTIAAYPKNLEKTSIQMILLLDLSGWNNGQIAAELDMSDARVSTIRNSPLYKQERDKRRSELYNKVLEETAGRIVEGDPVEKRIKELAVDAIAKKGFLMENAKSEVVQSMCASDILDRAGYIPKKTIVSKSIEVTSQMADRFERALQRPDRVVEKTKVTEVTSE